MLNLADSGMYVTGMCLGIYFVSQGLYDEGPIETSKIFQAGLWGAMTCMGWNGFISNAYKKIFNRTEESDELQKIKKNLRENYYKSINKNKI